MASMMFECGNLPCADSAGMRFARGGVGVGGARGDVEKRCTRWAATMVESEGALSGC